MTALSNYIFPELVYFIVLSLHCRAQVYLSIKQTLSDVSEHRHQKKEKLQFQNQSHRVYHKF